MVITFGGSDKGLKLKEMDNMVPPISDPPSDGEIIPEHTIYGDDFKIRIKASKVERDVFIFNIMDYDENQKLEAEICLRLTIIDIIKFIDLLKGILMVRLKLQFDSFNKKGGKKNV